MHIYHFYHAHIFSRLAIRHQLLVHGSTLTPGEIQVIENKQGRLQRLINAFEHQADLFLLQQSSLDDVAIYPVCNYTQYDQPDQHQQNPLEIAALADKANNYLHYTRL